MFVPCFAIQYLVSILVAREERPDCFILIVPCYHATVSVPCLFLTVWLVGLQYVIVVFSGLLILRIAHSIAAYPILYLTYREQIRL